MTKIEVVPTTPEHIRECVAHIRDKDRAEVWAASGRNPEDVLTSGLDHGAHTVFADGKVALIYGLQVSSPITKVGCPWMLTTTEVEKHKKLFLVLTRRMIQHWNKEHRLLFNYVDSRYTEAVRWLKWVGFTVHPAEPFGPFGVPFHRFDMVNEDV